MMTSCAIGDSVSSCVQELVDALRGEVSAHTVIRCGEALARRTTLRVGGPADLYVEPAGESDLAVVLRSCSERGVRFFLLGRGSNLLVRDGGYRGVVICLAQPGFCRIEVAGARLSCGAGARLKAVAGEAKRSELAGLEFLEGIPGTVGGALRMNAGAMGSSMFGCVESVRLMDAQGEVRERTPQELDVQYRGCTSLKSLVAVAAVLHGQPGVRHEIERRMSEYSLRRRQSQPAAPSAGCMFKNPAILPAGKLIDELGLKGTRVGGASVSQEHGNFLVNDGTATARDVLDLIRLVQERVRQERGIGLETEVEVIGE